MLATLPREKNVTLMADTRTVFLSMNYKVVSLFSLGYGKILNAYETPSTRTGDLFSLCFSLSPVCKCEEFFLLVSFLDFFFSFRTWCYIVLVHSTYPSVR